MGRNDFDQELVRMVSAVEEGLSTPGTSIADVVHELARLSEVSEIFAKLRWVKDEDDGSYKTKAPYYRQLRISGASAETDCLAIGENRRQCWISVDGRYFSAPINKGMLSNRRDGVYCNCPYSIAELERNLSGVGKVEIAFGESWTDRGLQFGPMGRDYRQVRIMADYDVVKRMLDGIRDKCKKEFFEILDSETQLQERVVAMKNSVSLDISGSGNQVSFGNGNVTQQQSTAKGMFSTAEIGDEDSSTHIEAESFVAGILRHWRVVVVILGVVGLLIAFVCWKGVNISVEKGDCKVNVQTR